MSKNSRDNNINGIWDTESEQNWVRFWNLLLHEDMKQNPDSYKRNHNKGVNGRQFSLKNIIKK
jgi:hypothetical protein